MSMTYEQHLHLALPSDDDQSHGPQLRTNWAALAKANTPKDCFFVSPDFTDANLSNALSTDKRHFPTIQEAVTAAEGAGHGHLATVFVYPGVYSENLVISNSVTIAGAVPPIKEGLGGGNGVLISGTASALLPTLRINPPGNTPTAVNLVNLCLINSYNQANAVDITQPYLLNVSKPAGYSQRLYLGMKNCQSRLQTSGVDNTWLYGLKVDGWVEMAVKDCDFTALDWAGGGEGGIQTLFHLRGDDPSHLLSFLGKNLNVKIDYGVAGFPVPAMFDIDGGVSGAVGRSQLPDNVILQVAGTAGSNNVAGLIGSTVEGYSNLLGIDLASF